ncbi:S26 family signal peptidase [Streptomyces sp. NPDC059917]|uniref:S26 family signal peptidase n=1 Tax=Streptomyces sp. NPDC059917 TaxID=3347002 RepID=UPI0036624F42
MIALAVAGAIGALLVALWAVHRYELLSLVEVSGSSMAPDFRPGDRVLAVRKGSWLPLRRGCAVIVDRTDPDGGPGERPPALFLKRLVAVPGDPVPAPFTDLPGFGPGERVPPGRFLVLGRHHASVDSKQWGYLRRSDVRAVVIGRV